MTKFAGQSLSDMLARERRARLAAERLLDMKQAELIRANRKLSDHAQLLSDEIINQREEVATVRSQAEQLEGQNSQAKEDLERANKLAIVAERRLWDALDTIEDGFAVFNADDRLVIANRAYLQMFDDMDGITPGITYANLLEIILNEGLFDIGAEDPIEWHTMMLDRWKQPEIAPLTVKLWNEKHIKLIDRRGQDGDMVTLSLDISDTIAYEEQLREERVKADAANRAKSAFLANMSHEIRTPMNGVVGMADLLCETELEEEQRLYAETIKSSGEALLVIINDVLDYSKIEAEKLTLHPAPFDFERAIHEVIVLLSPSAQDKGIDLLVDYDMFLPTRFVADPGRVRQILTNLVGNAVKFTTEGHVLVRVTGFADDAEPDLFTLHVTVEDTGIGIAEDKVDLIFGEFNQVEDERNRKFEGTGLGLAITKQLVQLMEGEIWVESTLDEGSCFGFRATFKAAEAADNQDLTVPVELRSALVVDDQQINRMILEKQLTTMGLDVTLCRSGAEALAERPSRFDVILTDHKMPEMSGLELAEKLREHGVVAPILLLTSNPSVARQDEARMLMDAVLQKPLLRRDLYRTLHELGGGLPETAAPEPEVEIEDSSPRQMRVLAAEDNRTNRLVFSKMVKNLNIELHFAENGREAVAQFEKIAPDLIFMDVSMPEMDGKEATRAIREIEAKTGGHVPICALTAHAMDGDDDEIMQSGMDHYLTKPLKKDAITARIKAHAPSGVTAPAPDTVES